MRCGGEGWGLGWNTCGSVQESDWQRVTGGNNAYPAHTPLTAMEGAGWRRGCWSMRAAEGAAVLRLLERPYMACGGVGVYVVVVVVERKRMDAIPKGRSDWTRRGCGVCAVKVATKYVLRRRTKQKGR